VTGVAAMRRALECHAKLDAMVWHGQVSTHGQLLHRMDQHLMWLKPQGVSAGDVVALDGDFSPAAVSLLLALAEMGCVVVPQARPKEARLQERMRVAGVQWHFHVDNDGNVATRRREVPERHPFYQQLAGRGAAGLVLFSSGSSGLEKAAVHDLGALLQRFQKPGRSWRTQAFLLFDHIGGLNTLFYTLANAGCVVALDSRDPDAVLASAARHRVRLLPTSPTFLRLALLSGAHLRHDVSGIERITYGTEPMDQPTLQAVAAAFPNAALQQTYGLSEAGILTSHSRAKDSLWVKLGGPSVETRVREGMLEIRSPSSMLGYLNAPQPFTPDGWLMTGDHVLTDGPWFRILGRASELINVGGLKVHASQVESVILELSDVAEVRVHALDNALTGQAVAAVVRPTAPPGNGLPTRVRAHCAQRLERFQVPVRVVVQQAALHGERFKKLRNV